jgi:hypothetical protein
MRYLESQVPPDAQAFVAPTTDAFVELTVALTLIIGLLALAAGRFGRQRWLTFWGRVTLLACAVYYVWTGLP